MNNIIEFKTLLAQIDAILDQCRPEEATPPVARPPSPGRLAHQNALLRQAVEQITEGLALFPFNALLLRRRSWARANIRTADGACPEMHLAVEDLQLLLEFDASDLGSAIDLLQEMDAVRGMPHSTVAEVASELSSRAEDLVIRSRVLHLRALLAAGDSGTAHKLYAKVTRQFSDSSKLRAFRSEIPATGHASLPPHT